LHFVTISDKKSETAFNCLVAMLPAGAKRGVKGPKMSAAFSISSNHLRYV